MTGPWLMREEQAAIRHSTVLQMRPSLKERDKKKTKTDTPKDKHTHRDTLQLHDHTSLLGQRGKGGEAVGKERVGTYTIFKGQ